MEREIERVVAVGDGKSRQRRRRYWWVAMPPDERYIVYLAGFTKITQ